MRYACRVLPSGTPAAEIESRLNDAADHGWDCVAVFVRPPELVIVFRGDFPNLSDWQIALGLLDSNH
jgi:hypothetical protein